MTLVYVNPDFMMMVQLIVKNVSTLVKIVQIKLHVPLV